MAKTFFFYDLETSGLSAQSDRIMQFAGIRTDEEFNQIGESYNLLVALNDDTLPSPYASLVTKITPQQTLADGYTEAQFARILHDEIFTEDTIVVGFNNVRFDDEFIRHLFWRNFYDPYEWAYKDGRSRWDLLDVVRMTRALRPEGIQWPVDDKGNPTNRLELLTSLNGISHENAHDALADVEALIAVTKLIKAKQPQLFSYLLQMRNKQDVMKLINLDDKQPFVYVSGRYENEYNKATVAFPLTSAPNKNVIVYDLRYDPAPFLDMSESELRDRLFASWEQRQADDFVRVPVKQFQYNRCPAVAPLGVLEQHDGWKKIQLDVDGIRRNIEVLLKRPDFAEKLRHIYESDRDFKKSTEVEGQLYDGFIASSKDKLRVEVVRNAEQNQLADLHPDFDDERLPPLLLHYKARNFPKSLSEDEHRIWEEWRDERLQAQLPQFMKDLQVLSKEKSADEDQFVLQELNLWLESVVPTEEY